MKVLKKCEIQAFEMKRTERARSLNVQCMEGGVKQVK